MNIFALDLSPVKSAEYACDKHVVKMIIETAQLLSTAIHIQVPRNENYLLYKTTHVHHPCSKWTRESRENFEWLVDYGIALSKEYTVRYGKYHKCEPTILQAKH